MLRKLFQNIHISEKREVIYKVFQLVLSTFHLSRWFSLPPTTFLTYINVTHCVCNFFIRIYERKEKVHCCLFDIRSLKTSIVLYFLLWEFFTVLFCNSYNFLLQSFTIVTICHLYDNFYIFLKAFLNFKVNLLKIIIFNYFEINFTIYIIFLNFCFFTRFLILSILFLIFTVVVFLEYQKLRQKL